MSDNPKKRGTSPPTAQSSPSRRRKATTPGLVTTAAGGGISAVKGQKQQKGWTFSSVSREPPPRQLGPASTKYNVNMDMIRPVSKAFSIGTKPLPRSKPETPAPGQYQVENPNYSGNVFISKVKKKSSIEAARKDYAEREMEGPQDFLRKSKGGKFSGVKRFEEHKTTDDSVGPGTYSDGSLPSRSTPGFSFSKAPSGGGGGGGSRGLGVPKALRAIPGPGSYDLSQDRMIGRSSSEMSFRGAVFISRHIDLGPDYHDYGSGGGVPGLGSIAADERFIRETNQDIQRWKLLSALRK